MLGIPANESEEQLASHMRDDSQLSGLVKFS